MVIAMLSPVSPSGTGKTLRSLTSCRRRSSSSQAAATTRRKRTSEGSRTVLFYTGPADGFGADGAASGGLGDLAGLEAASTDVFAPRGPPHVDADLLEVRLEAPLGG